MTPVTLVVLLGAHGVVLRAEPGRLRWDGPVPLPFGLMKDLWRRENAVLAVLMDEQQARLAIVTETLRLFEVARCGGALPCPQPAAWELPDEVEGWDRWFLRHGAQVRELVWSAQEFSRRRRRAPLSG